MALSRASSAVLRRALQQAVDQVGQIRLPKLTAVVVDDRTVRGDGDRDRQPVDQPRRADGAIGVVAGGEVDVRISEQLGGQTAVVLHIDANHLDVRGRSPVGPIEPRQKRKLLVARIAPGSEEVEHHRPSGVRHEGGVGPSTAYVAQPERQGVRDRGAPRARPSQEHRHHDGRDDGDEPGPEDRASPRQPAPQGPAVVGVVAKPAVTDSVVEVVGGIVVEVAPAVVPAPVAPTVSVPCMLLWTSHWNQ
jgi:hypothetical protein